MIELEKNGFRLEMQLISNSNRREKYRYQFWDDELSGTLPLFCGSDYECPSGYSEKKKVTGIIGFISLKPGDTDKEYFDKYTPKQMEWCKSGRAEELAMMVIEMEEQ